MNLGQWLQKRCEDEHLSLRQAGKRTGLSHSTIQGVMKGDRPSPQTITKLAQGFSDGTNQRLVLEDCLFTLAGYRTPRPEPVSEGLAQLMDKVRQFNDPQIEMMGHFADYISLIPQDRGGQ